jgi:hypothetical protein
MGKERTMKTTIDYSSHDNAIAKHNAAIADCRDYMGARFDLLVTELRKVESWDQFAALCGFVGIEGYPVKALWNHCHTL